jgi:hypothetical protein
MIDRKIVHSHGGGVQSNALVALIIQGVIPKPDFALIADTGRESSYTWSYLERYVQPAANAIGMKIHIVPHTFEGKGKYNYVDLFGGAEKKTLLIPAHSTINGDTSMLRGFCSNEWKRDPVRRYLREHGIKRADQYIGFSIDEMERCRTWVEKAPWRQVYPLIKLRLSRGDCISIVEKMGWPTPPRSACFMCPYHTDFEWNHMKINQPEDFARAVKFEQEIKKSKDEHVWLHKSAKPLDTIDFSDPEADLFAKPCESGSCFT